MPLKSWVTQNSVRIGRSADGFGDGPHGRRFYYEGALGDRAIARRVLVSINSFERSVRMADERTLSRSELLEALRASRDEVLAIVRALPPEQLEHGRYE